MTQANYSWREEIVPGKKTKESAGASRPAWADRLRYFSEHQHRIVNMIRELVEIESPSDNKPAVDRIAAFLAQRFEALGGRTRFHRSNDFGDSLSPYCSSATTTLFIRWGRSPICRAKSRTGVSTVRAFWI